MNHSRFSISPLFKEQVKKELMQFARFSEKSEQNCLYRFDLTTPQGFVRIKQFNNGTLYMEGSDKTTLQKLTELVQEITGEKKQELAVKKTVSSSGSQQGKIDLSVPYIGTDESGKGDYFGPLVIAGVYTTPELSQKLQALGVKDSKKLKDPEIKKLAEEIQKLAGANSWNIIDISPQRYNELYDSFKKSGKNLNHLLAWGHAKVLENLLEKNPDCSHAIADQFGSEHYINSQLQKLGKGITLHQTPKAEANTGVAAASIIARARFVSKVKALESKAGVFLPLGAGPAVLEQAKKIVNLNGSSLLKELAKLHFKTTSELL